MNQRMPFTRRSMRLRLAHAWAWVALAAILAVLVPAGSSGADKLDDLRSERDRVQSERAAAASQVDVSQGEVEQVQAALAELERLVVEQSAEVAAARATVVAAEAALAATEEQITLTEGRIDGVRENLRRLAIDAYLGRNNGADGDLALLKADDLSDGVRARAYLDFGSGNLGDLLDEQRALQADLEDLAEQRRFFVAEAERARAEEETQLAQLEEAESLQVQVVDQAESRLARMVGEAAALASLDAELAGEIQREEERIRAAIEAERRRVEEIRRRQAEEAARRPASSGGGSGGGGSGGSVTRPPIASPADMVSVNGILIHNSVADRLRSLLDAAAADGVILGGGGWRSAESQIALRRAHCGSSEYAIWQAPANSCSPPTARPGESMHERGLAVDFTVNRRAITSRSSEAFQWLAANAPGFGFKNLPSEPWHWSTTGQ
jgi:peptidoglycan hydrolase CwlO-like protein